MPALLAQIPTYTSAIAPADTNDRELQITLQENPVILRSGQTSVVIRGGVTIPHRNPAAFSAVVVQLVGMKSITSPLHMGGSGLTRETIYCSECTLYPSTVHGACFEFVLDAHLPPTLCAPQYSVEYTVTATPCNCTTSQRLASLFSRRYRAVSMSLTLVSYAVTENLYDLQLRMQPTVKQGLLGNVPVCVVLDKGVVCPGDSATFHIVIDPPPSSSSDGEGTLSVDEATESADASLSDSSTSGMLHSREHRGRRLLRKPCPAHNQNSQPSCAWGYKVRATLVQHTRYIFERSHTPGRYSFRDSKNVTHAHLPSTLVPAQATSDAGTHLTLALQIPSQLQCQVRTSELAVSYSLRLEFFPR
ncbi:hypothetical protein IWW55_005279, partial [Coemansia sp. RSA 2706]